VLLIISAAIAFGQDAASLAQKPYKGSPESQIYTREGVSVEFSIDRVSINDEKASRLVAGTEATLRFKIHDAGNSPLSSLRPSAWIDRSTNEQATGARECREKIQSFLQPSFSKRPDIDLNAFFILVLNHEPNISVIDPLFGFGGSKLYALIALPGTGEDWVMSSDKKRLYVTVPGVNQVAVIDTVQWKVIAKIEAGVEPGRIALQHDGKYLWIGNNNADDRQSGVTVIDTGTLKVAAQLTVGAGPHELALTEDDRFVFVTNKQAGTLSVIDVSKLSRISDIKIGDRPAALAFSNLSKAVYVASEGDGTITAVDTVRLEIIARMKAEPGLRVIRIPPDSRFGFAVNPATNKIYIFDSAANRIQHSVLVGPGADQIAFTKEFAYVRAPGNEFVTMIRISDLDKNEEVAVNRFPAGQKAPKDSPASSLADAIVSAPGNDSVLVANPADKMIYYYTEGMAAPMGSFQNYRRDPKALLVLANGLAESSGGVYSTTVRLPNAGRYDVAFLLDSPRLVSCFPVVIAENPALPKPKPAAIKIEPLSTSATARVGRAYNLRFKVIDSGSGQLKPDLEDVGVLVFLAPGIWQERQWAKSIGGGIYEVSFVPPDSGVYYVYFQCPSLGMKFSELTPIILRAN
ncbi:MAG: beta-propeller fold lactonase family protein, partial [Acidobacteriota bacterium]